MAAFDDFLKKLNLTPDEAMQIENRISPKFKWTTGHPVEIMVALERTMPPEWTDFEPETLFKLVHGSFGDVKKDELKILALQVAMTTDRPWMDWDVFENTCLNRWTCMKWHSVWDVLMPFGLILTEKTFWATLPQRTYTTACSFSRLQVQMWRISLRDWRVLHQRVGRSSRCD